MTSSELRGSLQRNFPYIKFCFFVMQSAGDLVGERINDGLPYHMRMFAIRSSLFSQQ